MSYDIEFYEDNAKTPGENDYVFVEYNLSYNYNEFLSLYNCNPRVIGVTGNSAYVKSCRELLTLMIGHDTPLSTHELDRAWVKTVNCTNEWNTPLQVVRYLRWVCEMHERFPNKKMRCIG